MQKQSSTFQNFPVNQKSNLTTRSNQTPFQFHLHNQLLLLDENKFHKSLLTHFTASKSASYETDINNSIDLHHIKHIQKLLKRQPQPSKLHFALDNQKHFENQSLLPIISDLPSLSSLSLQFSGFYKSFALPAEILFKSLASPKNLNHLDFSFHCFKLNNQKILKNLMKTIRKLKRVSSLSLTFFIYSGFTPSHYNILFTNLAKMTQLRQLKLSFVNSDNLENTDVETIASLLPRLAHLTKVHLNLEGDRFIEQQTFLKLFKAFQSLKNLTDLALNLQKCNITNTEGHGSAPISLLECFQCLNKTSIQKLSFGLSAHFSTKNLRELSKTLKQLVLLKSFSLFSYDWRFLKDDCISEFGLALACLSSLTSLSLYFPFGMQNTNIIHTLAFALRSLRKLESLKLELGFNNNTQEVHFQALFTNLRDLKALKYLDIRIPLQDTITDDSLEVFGESLKQLNLLKGLSLDFGSVREITNKGVEAICCGIQEGLGNLLTLNLKFENNENLNERMIGKLGEALQALASLYSVDLYFEGCENIADFKELFRALRGMKNLGEVTLSLPESEENNRGICSLKKIKNLLVNS